MGRFRAIVTRVGITTIAVVSAGTIALAITHAVADSGSNESEEAIRTAPETFPNLSAVPAQTSAPTARAETVATQTPVPILPLEAAESSAKAMRGSGMDDVIFEEFKGTGNCEIKLDRSLSEKRIFPAFDIATSGTRREEKLYREDQLQAIYMLRRGLQQMPASTGMEWLIKRIAGTPNNDALLTGL